jgi:hypothetical protein
VLQKPGDIILNLAGALHKGYNLGANVAVVTNFAFFSDNWVHRSIFPHNCPCYPPPPIYLATFLRLTNWSKDWFNDKLNQVHAHSTPCRGVTFVSTTRHKTHWEGWRKYQKLEGRIKPTFQNAKNSNISHIPEADKVIQGLGQ